MTSWKNTRPHILPHLERLVKVYPGYQLTLVGHSLGGAVAALASLDFHARGWKPQVTTFGEPRIGNSKLAEYIDKAFPANDETNSSQMYRRVTHIRDPVPLLPLQEWGYEMHAGEIYISKPDLPPEPKDLGYCDGDADPNCIAGGKLQETASRNYAQMGNELSTRKGLLETSRNLLPIPARFRIWQLFFAHRDYFWRLGLCVPFSELD